MNLRWGIVPAAGRGTRLRPLAFSKELLPVGTRLDRGVERPCAVTEYLLDRMITSGVDRLCFVISPDKTDIVRYFGARIENAPICYTVQQNPKGLCDALFCVSPFVDAEDEIYVGLPDTIWFPVEGFSFLPDGQFSFLLFPVEHPELFDSVLADQDGQVERIEVKQEHPRSEWVWGAFKLTGRQFDELHGLWLERGGQDEYWGTLVNAYLEQGGRARAVKRGDLYVDVGTLHGYREGLRLVSEHAHMHQLAS
jgi:dTDP-glucose pyrophosphorylase